MASRVLLLLWLSVLSLYTAFVFIITDQWMAQSGASQVKPAFRAQFLLFGDSITQRSFQYGGWGAHLANAYQRKVDVLNRGYSGYNSRWALQLLDRVLPAEKAGKILLATVFFGANDAALAERTS